MNKVSTVMGRFPILIEEVKEGVIKIALQLSAEMRDLLLAINLGRSREHPLAGWLILRILYQSMVNTDEPRTLNYLGKQYNQRYLDVEAQEAPITDAVLKKVLSVLTEQARMVEITPRKVRRRMQSGAYHMQQTSIYRITSRGIEYLSLLPKVLDAESTVTANTSRIEEYCELIKRISVPHPDTTTTRFYNDFRNMMTAYDDVMKGMHKLGEDLDELANDLAFDHGGHAAQNLQQLLTQKALPAFYRLLDQGPIIQKLAQSADLPRQIARSFQGKDNLSVAKATDNQGKLTTQFNGHTKDFANQLTRLAGSFEPTTTALDNNYDSIYLILQTILAAIHLLSEEYDHVNRQTIDIQQLTQEIDGLLKRYQTVVIPQTLPRHLPQDRQVTDAADLLDATTLGPIKYLANARQRVIATSADNPVVATDEMPTVDQTEAVREFQRLVMQDDDHGQVAQDLEVTTRATRDEIIRLYSATGYDHYQSFAPFGRAIVRVTALATPPIWVHCQDERYSVQLPSGFTFAFETEAD